MANKPLHDSNYWRNLIGVCISDFSAILQDWEEDDTYRKIDDNDHRRQLFESLRDLMRLLYDEWPKETEKLPVVHYMTICDKQGEPVANVNFPNDDNYHDLVRHGDTVVQVKFNKDCTFNVRKVIDD